MTLIDRAGLVAGTNNAAYADTVAYSDAYIDEVIADVHDEISTFLRWDPVLSLRQNEVGLVEYLADGDYAGRFMLELKGQPLPNVLDATSVFSSLALTYAMAFQDPGQVVLSQVKMNPRTGQVWCLAPGLNAALAAVAFGYGTMTQGVAPTGYLATYYAGFTTGVNDPTPPVGMTWNNTPALPGDIRQAALLLIRERIAYDDAQNDNPQNPQAGFEARVKVEGREAAYRQKKTGEQESAIGYGSWLAESAMHKLDRRRRRLGMTVI